MGCRRRNHPLNFEAVVELAADSPAEVVAVLAPDSPAEEAENPAALVELADNYSELAAEILVVADLVESYF